VESGALPVSPKLQVGCRIGRNIAWQDGEKRVNYPYYWLKNSKFEVPKLNIEKQVMLPVKPFPRNAP